MNDPANREQQPARPRRSVLYMPGANARALEKAKTLAADALILDLEDAVAPDAKEMARQQVCKAAQEGGYGLREVVIRINSLDSEWGAADLEAGVAASPDAILVPKVSTGGDIERANAEIDRLDRGGKVAMWAMMETPLAMLNAGEIAATARSAGCRLAAFVLGTNDLAKETGASLHGGRIAMLSWLSTCVAAARAYGIAVVDGVYNDFRDADGFEAECRQGRMLGMDGKTLIHPGQIAACNAVFSPSEEDIERARKIIAAFKLPENAGKGVITVDGRMTELLHKEIAERTVAVADAIRAMSES